MKLRPAFTLVEMLVVIAVIGTLVSLLMPAVQTAREAARLAACKNNLKQLGIALHHYHEVHRGMPTGWIASDPVSRRPLATGEPGWGWASMTLPFLEAGAVSESLIDFGQSIAAPSNETARRVSIPGLLCPTDSRLDHFELTAGGASKPIQIATANYVGVFGTRELDECEGLPPGVTCQGDGIFHHMGQVRIASIRDGVSNTIMVGERASRFGHSTWPGAVPGAEEAIARILGIADHPPNSPGGHLDDFSSEHPLGTNFLFADGSVRILSESIELVVYRAIATRDGHEAVSADRL